MWVVLRTTEGLYLWHLSNSLKNQDLCDQRGKWPRQCGDFCGCWYEISAELRGDAACADLHPSTKFSRAPHRSDVPRQHRFPVVRPIADLPANPPRIRA